MPRQVVINGLPYLPGQLRPDWSSRVGAHTLADHLIQFWKDKGYYGIRAWIDQFRFRSAADVRAETGWFAVRSNIVNGFPPKMAEKTNGE